MRNTQTGLFSGLFVIIGHNLVICTEIWSILQRTAGTLLFLLSWGEKYWDWWTNCQTSKLKLQVHYKYIKSYSLVTVKCIFISPCDLVIFMLWHFIVFLKLFVFWSYSVYCLVKPDDIFALNTLSLLYLLDILIFWANRWHIFDFCWTLEILSVKSDVIRSIK